MLAGAIFFGSVGLSAQPLAQPLQNVVQLAASGALEVPQDLLVISLSTTRDGSDPALLQEQLKAAIDAALVQARKAVQTGQLEVRSGNFSLSPRYGRDGKAIGWQGSAELILEGRDFARISAVAGRLQPLTVSAIHFSLSREQRQKVEGQAQAMAIERFKARATEIARGFGFDAYTLREINVSSSDQGIGLRPRMLALEARAGAADAPVPVEAGKTTVLVTVSGSVQLK
jgi:predicted secreted protein